jgi:hypothetical protein
MRHRRRLACIEHEIGAQHGGDERDIDDREVVGRNAIRQRDHASWILEPRPVITCGSISRGVMDIGRRAAMPFRCCSARHRQRIRVVGMAIDTKWSQSHD